jgi:16S rRNA (cytidine1402-2'-O)-methyltransferase
MVMMASGQNGQSFAFNGYLPIKEPDRSRTIRNYERRAQQERQAQIFIEAPYRNIKLFDTLINTLSAKMRLTVACDITSKEEIIITRSIEEWKRAGVPNIEKRPTIFVLGI